jgi:N-acyl-D-amino-acid deacylase
MKRLATLAAFFLVLSLPASAQQFDVLIRNGRVVDGTGNPWFYADVGVVRDRITFIGRAPAEATAGRTIDARGLVVAPGFIDMLGWSETNVLIDRRAWSKITQGVTTEVTGEGWSIAPIDDRLIEERRDFFERFKLNVDWRTLEQYFQRLEREPPTINLATFVGATQLRRLVVGDDDRDPTPQELERMQRLVDYAMRDGALGVSTSLIYAPAFYAKTEELIALARVAGQHGGMYITHMRNEGDHIRSALEEAFRIGREAGVPVEIWHLKVAGRQNWGRMNEALALIERARAEGLEAGANMYPYPAGATSLGATIPPQFHDGGNEALLKRLADAEQRAAIRRALQAPGPHDFENWWQGTGTGGEGILVVSVFSEERRHYQGKRISEIARLENKDPLETLMDLVVAERNRVGAVYFAMDEADVRRALAHPWVAIGTDHGAVAPDGPLSEARAHPRAWGSFPRILGRYVREERLLRLEDAIRKFTSLPAQRVKLRDRGLLRTGYFADITIFHPERVRDLATFEDPNRTSEGIEYVLVNGALTLENGKLTGAFAGRPLRGPGYAARDRSPEGLAQPGVVHGVITDEEGWPLPRTQVLLLDEAGQVLAEQETRLDGRYEFRRDQGCAPCSVRAQRMGFATAEKRFRYNGANSLWFSFSLKREP